MTHLLVFYDVYIVQKMLQQIKYDMCFRSIGTKSIRYFLSRRRLNIILHVSSPNKRFRFLQIIEFRFFFIFFSAFIQMLSSHFPYTHRKQLTTHTERYLTLIKVSSIYLLLQVLRKSKDIWYAHNTLWATTSSTTTTTTFSSKNIKKRAERW